MDDLDLLSEDNASKHRKEGEDCWKGRFAVYDQEWDMVDLQTVGEVVHPSTTLVCVSDDYHFVASINQFGGELVDVAFDSSWLWEEEVTDHSDVVRHLDASRGDLSPGRYMSSIAESTDR